MGESPRMKGLLCFNWMLELSVSRIEMSGKITDGTTISRGEPDSYIELPPQPIEEVN